MKMKHSEEKNKKKKKKDVIKRKKTADGTRQKQGMLSDEPRESWFATTYF